MNRPKKREIFICINKRAGGAACIGQGAIDALRALINEAKQRGNKVKIKRNVCMGYCGQGPNVKIRGGEFFHDVKPEDAKMILDAEEDLNE
ncbi:MAG: hypothetical protein COB59_11240 [Rhodospirillaceae bacterium]|nr:MAG: hypothetical protein COB59_11240 [Rhodospirillaceae bacterium]